MSRRQTPPRSRRVLIAGTRRTSLKGSASKHVGIVTERDDWVRALPGRSFEVSKTKSAAAVVWTITLLQHSHIVAIGRGASWEAALAQALEESRRTEASSADGNRVSGKRR